MATVTIEARRRGRHVAAAVAGRAGLAAMNEVRERTVVAARARGSAVNYAELMGARRRRALLRRVDEGNRDRRGERADQCDDEQSRPASTESRNSRSNQLTPVVP
jgi:hypothetical protein